MRIGTILPFQSLRKLGPTGSTRFIVARKTEISQLRRATIVGDRRERSMDKVHERPVVTEANKEALRADHTGDHLRYIHIASCALFIVIALFVRP